MLKYQKYQKDKFGSLNYVGCGPTAIDNHLGTLVYLFDSDFRSLEYILKDWTTLKIEGFFVDVVRHDDDFAFVTHYDIEKKAGELILTGLNLRVLLSAWKTMQERKCHSACFGITPHNQIILWCKDKNTGEINQELLKIQYVKVLPAIVSSINIKKCTDNGFALVHSDGNKLLSLFYFFCFEVEKNKDNLPNYSSWTFNVSGGNITTVSKEGNVITVTTDFSDDEDDEENVDNERPQKISLDNLVILFEQWKKALASESPFIIFEEDEKGWITLRESDS